MVYAAHRGPGASPVGPLSSNVRPHERDAYTLPRRMRLDTTHNTTQRWHKARVEQLTGGMMSTVVQSIGYRIIWASLAAALCAFSIYRATSGQGWSHIITAGAWALFAVSWFLQPMVLASSVRAVVSESSKAAVGNPTLRLAVTVAALGMLVVGLAVLWLGGA